MKELNKHRIFWHSRRGMLELDLLLVPFVQDVDFMISKKFNLDNQPFELRPAIILFNEDRTIKWKKIGRSNQYFSDQAIEDYFDCDNWI